MAKLIGIAIRPLKQKEMIELDEVEITIEQGVAGDKRKRAGKRQVTLLSMSAWDAVCKELGVILPWTTRRANLLVDHLDLIESIGSIITLGDVELEITGETDPCKIMETAHAGLLDALKPEWRGGVTCRVLTGGNANIGVDVVIHK